MQEIKSSVFMRRVIEDFAIPFQVQSKTLSLKQFFKLIFETQAAHVS